MTEQLEMNLNELADAYMVTAKENIQQADVEIMSKLRDLAGGSEETYNNLTQQVATILRTKFLAANPSIELVEEAPVELGTDIEMVEPVDVQEDEAPVEVAE